MSKLLAVFGATGHQGGSVINHVLNDTELSQQYTIRGLTRNVTSEKAKDLSARVQVVAADMEDRPSVESALKDVHTVFIVTTPSFGPSAMITELNVAKMVADVAVDQGVQHIIFSTLPGVSRISNGKYTAVTPFDAKANAEEYIRTLPVNSAFVSLGYYMDNFQTQPFIAPRLCSDGVWVFKRPQSQLSKMPFVDAVRDTGKFVGAILAEPETYRGKTFCAAQSFYTLEELLKVLSKGTGQSIVFEQVTDQEFRDDFQAPWGVDMFSEAFAYGEEYGYYGPGGEEQVAWAVANARGTLTSFEQFLQANPFQFK